MEEPFAESFKIKMVEPVFRSTREQRNGWIKEARYNIFNLKSEQVYIDLLTDSGTSAMSQQQWAEMMLGDESYAGANSYYKLKQSIRDLFGLEYFLPVHQGRAAENVLFSVLVKEGDIVPGQCPFRHDQGSYRIQESHSIGLYHSGSLQYKPHSPFQGQY